MVADCGLRGLVQRSCRCLRPARHRLRLRLVGRLAAPGSYACDRGAYDRARLDVAQSRNRPLATRLRSNRHVHAHSGDLDLDCCLGGHCPVARDGVRTRDMRLTAGLRAHDGSLQRAVRSPGRQALVPPDALPCRDPAGHSARHTDRAAHDAHAAAHLRHALLQRRRAASPDRRHHRPQPGPGQRDPRLLHGAQHVAVRLYLGQADGNRGLAYQHHF